MSFQWDKEDRKSPTTLYKPISLSGDTAYRQRELKLASCPQTGQRMACEASKPRAQENIHLSCGLNEQCQSTWHPWQLFGYLGLIREGKGIRTRLLPLHSSGSTCERLHINGPSRCHLVGGIGRGPGQSTQKTAFLCTSSVLTQVFTGPLAPPLVSVSHG